MSLPKGQFWGVYGGHTLCQTYPKGGTVRSCLCVTPLWDVDGVHTLLETRFCSGVVRGLLGGCTVLVVHETHTILKGYVEGRPVGGLSRTSSV